jgi:hypothetical protein
MRKAIGTVAVLVLVTLGVGLYRGWFGVPTTQQATGDDRVNFSVDVDKAKIKQDAAAVKERASQFIDQTKENTNGLGK